MRRAEGRWADEGDAASRSASGRWPSDEAEAGASGPGKAGCPGAENDDDRNLLEPGTAAQRPFGDDAGGGRNRQWMQDQ